MDRLRELKDVQDGPDDVSSSDAPEITQVTEVYETIKDSFKTIKSNTTKVKALKEKEKKTSSENERKSIMQQMNTILTETNQVGTQTRKKFDAIKAENASSGDSKASATYQVKENLFNKYVREFRDTMKDFNSASDDFKKNLQDRTRRELKNVGIPDQDVERVIESGNAQEVIHEAVTSDNLEDMVNDIESRHSNILQLEKQVLEVQELFLDLANLVSLQGETIVSIEDHISQSKVYTEDAATHIAEAEDYQKKARKRQCCIVIIVVVVLLVILGPTLGVALKGG